MNTSTHQRLKAIVKDESTIDLTFGEEIPELKNKFYDWLSFEILNQSPDIIITPFGSGNLFSGIIEIMQREIALAENNKQPSKRFFGNADKLNKTTLIGVTTYAKKSKFDKLYSPIQFHPEKSLDLDKWKKDKIIDEKSKIVEVNDHKLEEALNIAEEYKLNTEPSGIAALAWFLDNHEDIDPSKKILIVNTGKIILNN